MQTSDASNLLILMNIRNANKEAFYVRISESLCWPMRNHHGFVSVTLACLTLVLLVSVSPLVYASQATKNYATYSVTLTNGNYSQSFTVKESVQPSSVSGFSILTLTLAGMKENLTYSKVVNSSSSMLFPLLPVANNQSIVYRNQNYSVSLSINRTGTSSVTFNGSSYRLTNYNFNASLTFLNYSHKSFNGHVSVLPSSLVYSAQIRFNQTTLTVQLLSTNLSLDPPASNSANFGEMIAVSVVGAAVVLLGILYGIKRISRKPETQTSPQDGKPPYWVD